MEQKITTRMISKYKRLTDMNFHGEVLEAIAKDLNIDYYYQIFKSINKIHNLEECLKPDLENIRLRFKKEFVTQLKEILSDEDFKLLLSHL